jgi:hypothetical protein
MNLESLDAGVYFLSVENSKGVTTKRILKK